MSGDSREARRSRFLADHNDVLELIESADQDDFAAWYATLGVLLARGSHTNDSSNAFWLLSKLAAHWLRDTANCRGMSLGQALHQARIEGIDQADHDITGWLWPAP